MRRNIYNRNLISVKIHLSWLLLSYQGEVDTTNKISKYTKAMGVINNVPKPSLVQRHTQLCLYKTLTSQSYAMGVKHRQYKNKISELQLVK
jgi:hypothetical protein